MDDVLIARIIADGRDTNGGITRDITHQQYPLLSLQPPNTRPYRLTHPVLTAPRAGLTQPELASRAGASQMTISRIEVGAVIPRRETLEKLLEACSAPNE